MFRHHIHLKKRKVFDSNAGIQSGRRFILESVAVPQTDEAQ